MSTARVTLLLLIVCCILLPLLPLLAVPDGSEGRHCEDPYPPIIVASKKNDHSHYPEHTPSYGDDITLLCSSSNAFNLVIRGKEYQQIVEQLNSTTIHVTVKKPNLGRHSYHCTDRNTKCTASLIKYIKPAMSVEGPCVHHTLDREGSFLYFAPRKEGYNVSCSGDDADSLSMQVYLHNWYEVQTTKINKTTITATVTDDRGGDYYFCESKRAGVAASITIIRDYYPEAQKLRCLQDNQRKLLMCNWRSSSKKNIYDLFILHDQGSTVLCSYSSGEEVSGCSRALDSNLLDLTYGRFFLQVRTCNAVFCNNQTFLIKTFSITKLAPVRNLKMLNINSRSVAVTWRQDVWDKLCKYKVEYKLLGTDWRQVNESMKCRVSYDTETAYTCQLSLTLPCPDAHYELRVYVRVREATEDIHWSEPTHVFFFTAPGAGETGLDPECNADFIARPPPVTAEAAFNEAQKLVSDERKARSALKKLVSNLKIKMAKIKNLMSKRK